MIKSPYNFVPAPSEQEVFTPDWADQVSHDIPFSDGESGEIEFTITAETPIFIRNGHSKDDAEIFEKFRSGDLTNATEKEREAYNRYISFSNIDGKYFIPATSIKGMLRNVMEIMSFAPLNPNLVNDDRYSHRDLTDGSLYRAIYDTNKIQCGWLKLNDNKEWVIDCCGKPLRISYEEIDKAFKTNFNQLLAPEAYTKLINYKEIHGKHNFQSEGKTYTLELKHYTLNKDKTKVSKKLKPELKNAKGKYDILKNKTSTIFNTIIIDGVSYILIMTGSPSFEKQKEFLFPTTLSSSIPLSKDQKIAEKKKKDFLFTYKDHDSNNISVDWRFWREELKKPDGKVPVFFTEENGEVKHFGLSYMYKLPYKNSIHETKTMNWNKNHVDLVQCIFGRTDSASTKGRVFISNTKHLKGVELNLKKEILSSPKASYLPFYIKQKDGKNGDYKYLSYNDDIDISGFKRYPVHSSEKDFTKEFIGAYDNRQLTNLKVFSFFKPLDKNSAFKCKIRFHNLRPIELGALLSALTFHGYSKSAFHSLGGAKPYGFGKISISELNLINHLSVKLNENEFLLKFEEFMNSKVSNWLNSDRLKSLFSYSMGKSDLSLEYMGIPEFVNLKNETKKEYLKSDIKIDNLVSIKKKLEPQELLNLSSFEKYDEMAKFLNDKLQHWAEFSEENKLKIFQAVENIFNGEHRDSTKKLKTEYPWKNTIPKWLGQEQAQALYNQLMNPK